VHHVVANLKTASIIIAIAPFLAASALAQPEDLEEGFNFECEFDKHYAVYLNEDRAQRYEKGITRLNIIDERTSTRTKSLDGSVRATNSNQWTLASSKNYERAYIGSDGDLLTIYYRPDDEPKAHIASLQWGNVFGYAYTSIGACYAS